MEKHKTITAHMIVKNEDQWVWFVIMSVINYVDKMLIFDTGSIDRTVEIITLIMNNPKYKEKIYFEECGSVTVDGFSRLRQRQLDMTNTDYVILVDGDEIWWKDALVELHEVLDTYTPDIVNVKFICPCTDIFHYRDFSRESYADKQNGIFGSISGRVFSMSIPGINCSGAYGVEGFCDENGEWDNYPARVLNHFYFHCSKLRRSSAILGDESIPYRRKKVFDDWDYEFPKDYQYPEVFYLDRPSGVPNPFTSKDNFCKRIIKRIVRVYRFCFKRNEYVKIRERKSKEVK